jgi:hypothetical protein
MKSKKKKRKPARKKITIRERMELVAAEFNDYWGLEPEIPTDDISMTDQELKDIIKEEASGIEPEEEFSEATLDTLDHLGVKYSCQRNPNNKEYVNEKLQPKKQSRERQKKLTREQAMIKSLTRNWQNVYEWSEIADELYVDAGGPTNTKQQVNMIKVALRILTAIKYVEVEKLDGVKKYRRSRHAELFNREIENAES